MYDYCLEDRPKKSPWSTLDIHIYWQYVNITIASLEAIYKFSIM